MRKLFDKVFGNQDMRVRDTHTHTHTRRKRGDLRGFKEKKRETSVGVGGEPTDAAKRSRRALIRGRHGGRLPARQRSADPPRPLVFFFLLPETPFESNLFADEAALTPLHYFFLLAREGGHARPGRRGEDDHLIQAPHWGGAQHRADHR